MSTIIKNNIRHFHALGLFICIIIIVFGLVGCVDNNKADLPHYDSHEDAIAGFLNTEKNLDITNADLGEMLFTSFSNEKADYYVIKEIEDINGKGVPKVYVLKVTEDKGEYICDKYSEDYSLATPDNVDDKDYTPCLEFVIPVDGFYLHVGSVFDSNYVPSYNGKNVTVEKDKTFAYVTNDKDADTKWIKTK